VIDEQAAVQFIPSDGVVGNALLSAQSLIAQAMTESGMPIVKNV